MNPIEALGWALTAGAAIPIIVLAIGVGTVIIRAGFNSTTNTKEKDQ